MTDTNRSMDEVPALIEERRRYEGWLAALDARRESTPIHVFERVHADYRGRLERVVERLASHRQAIEEERASVQSRVSLLEAEERLRRDERAELDLRAHVGELIGDDAVSAFREVDDAIDQLVGEKGNLQARIAELQGLLDEGQVAPPETVAEPAAEPVPQPAAAAAVEPAAETQANAAAAATAGETPAAAAREAPRPAESRSGRGPKADAGPHTPSGSFDELAFLSSVVEKDEELLVERRNSTPILPINTDVERDEPVAESLLAGIENAKRKTGEHPLAANVPANTPIVLRPTGTIEQSKTLKCNECGALNYPTEWYCERCGAELAAL